MRGRELLVSVVHDKVDDAIAEVLGIDRERQWARRFRCEEVAQRPEERCGRARAIRWSRVNTKDS